MTDKVDFLKKLDEAIAAKKDKKETNEDSGSKLITLESVEAKPETGLLKRIGDLEAIIESMKKEREEIIDKVNSLTREVAQLKAKFEGTADGSDVALEKQVQEQIEQTEAEISELDKKILDAKKDKDKKPFEDERQKLQEFVGDLKKKLAELQAE